MAPTAFVGPRSVLCNNKPKNKTKQNLIPKVVFERESQVDRWRRQRLLGLAPCCSWRPASSWQPFRIKRGDRVFAPAFGTLVKRTDLDEWFRFLGVRMARSPSHERSPSVTIRESKSKKSKRRRSRSRSREERRHKRRHRSRDRHHRR